ncbi:DNA polymerase-3 subunit epsilon [Cryobacterium psychrotolerans]|uniref:DNA polymerase-3 subunit epsilon n=1 Tax=Cryobacterium psychrotolerans TaxID=386301 RepID=A0A1G8XLF7_9MICO|nr:MULTISPECIES: exonuclease domain-containing protein [Cryobacterium]TFD44948.1 DNA polymerase III subunit epsilon [Cryobacterium sp. TMT1-2-1]TFD82868.1 DNA polymerase III subunit epsilon [Cryobacterium psychrotolerans]SDJ91418.1 DNA polymerase-3 subunit epsilon [Cryobacterium psychrotolerans]
MPLNFTAIDFETANSSAASACSVGMVKVRDGKVVERVGWFIRPPVGHDAFQEWNIKIHGIRPSDVAGAAGWAAQLPDLVAFADGDHLVAHNAGFDLGVISTSSTVAGLAIPDFAYVCSLQVARRTYHLDSYRLPVAAMAAGFEDFAHHDALADAEACAAIMIHAAQRHEADTLEQLAHITGVKIGVIGPVATREHAATHGPMALN